MAMVGVTPRTTAQGTQESFDAQVIVHPGEISAGYAPVLDATPRTLRASSKASSKMDRRSGKVLDAAPKFVKNGDAARLRSCLQGHVR